MLRPPLQVSAQTSAGQLRVVRFGDVLRLQMEVNSPEIMTPLDSDKLAQVIEICQMTEIERLTVRTRELLEALLQQLPPPEAISLGSPLPLSCPFVDEQRTWVLNDRTFSVAPSHHSLVLLTQVPDRSLRDLCGVLVEQIIGQRTAAIRHLYANILQQLQEHTSMRATVPPKSPETVNRLA